MPGIPSVGHSSSKHSWSGGVGGGSGNGSTYRVRSGLKTGSSWRKACSATSTAMRGSIRATSGSSGRRCGRVRSIRAGFPMPTSIATAGLRVRICDRSSGALQGAASSGDPTHGGLGSDVGPGRGRPGIRPDGRPHGPDHPGPDRPARHQRRWHVRAAGDPRSPGHLPLRARRGGGDDPAARRGVSRRQPHHDGRRDRHPARSDSASASSRHPGTGPRDPGVAVRPVHQSESGDRGPGDRRCVGRRDTPGPGRLGSVLRRRLRSRRQLPHSHELAGRRRSHGSSARSIVPATSRARPERPSRSTRPLPRWPSRARRQA